MKRDLIYLTLIVAAIAAVKVTARTTPETPAEIRPLRIEAGFTKTVHILFPSPVTYIDIGSMDIIAGKAEDKKETIYEIADLAYHVMVLMIELGISVEDITKELEKRHVIDHKVKQERMQ